MKREGKIERGEKQEKVGRADLGCPLDGEVDYDTCLTVDFPEEFCEGMSEDSSFFRIF